MGKQAAMWSNQVIQGRWHRKSYQVIQRLGSGAFGTVYLVRQGGQIYAMKVSSEANGISLEYRLLKLLQEQYQLIATNRARRFRLGPFVTDLDDFTAEDGTTHFFYAMEYISGVPLHQIIQEQGNVSVREVVTHILKFLHLLHQWGYAFGDLKAENILVNPRTGQVRVIDFGGVTQFKQGIRQYTEWNDRGFWGAGTRQAEPQYDLFAVAMLIVQLLKPDLLKMSGGEKGLREMQRRLAERPETRAWLPVLQKAWQGKFATAEEMYREVTRIQFVAKKVEGALTKEWDWSHWILAGSAVICLSVILRVLVVK